MSTLYIIDGFAQFFRAYHAIRTPMTSPVTKEPTNMTFGFVGMLLKLMRGETPAMKQAGGKPDYVMVALEGGGDTETFRSTIYPEYKTNRPPPPEDLMPQVERCLAMLRTLGVPLFSVPGFEADDVIATAVRALRKTQPDLRIRIVSKDKDLKQLLGPGVELFDIHTDLVFDARTLEQDTGLKPEQIVDMLALTGDTVDNVPGVPGVGEKTAAQLLVEHGTLDNLLAHADAIKGKRGENIRAAIGTLPLSRTLVTLRDDVPMELDLDACAASRVRLDELIPILKELGFNRYQDDVRAITGKGPASAAGDAATRGGQTMLLDDGVVVPVVSGVSGARSKPAAPDPGGMEGGLFAAIAAGEPREVKPQHEGHEYVCVTTREQLDDLVARIRDAEVFAFDTETDSLSVRDANLCGISICVKPGTAYYIPLRSPEPGKHLSAEVVLAALRPLLEDANRPKVAHNLKFDLLVLRNAGVAVRGIALPGSCDPMVASYLIDSSRSSHSLDALSLALLGRGKQSISELIGSGKTQRTFDTVAIELATPYAAADAELTLELSQVMLPQLKAMGLTSLFQDVEMPLVEVLADLEWAGIKVDPAELERQRSRLSKRIEAIIVELDGLFVSAIGRRVDPDSPKQLSAALFNTPEDATPGLGLKSSKKTKTGASTDAEVLEKLAEDPEIGTPIPTLILEYRQLSKLVSTYLIALRDAINPRTGRVHARFNQTVAATGRLSSSDPNLQNIPIRTDLGREIRKAFVAEPGKLLVSADYSQIELRLLAHLSRDAALIEAFQRGDDIHAAVAAQIHGVPLEQVTKDQRSGAKMVNFGIVYGITSYGLARRLGIDEKAAAEIIAGYKRRFSGITTFLQECVEQAKRHGYVETMLKRRRMIPDIESNVPNRRALAERTAINSVVQGSAADLIKLAMIDLHARAKRGELASATMLLQIHDELVFEADAADAPRVRDIVVDRMEKAMSLRVPLKADARISADWAEGK
ncbi:MAG: DNA polymerase I [Planctomycetota bacterium]|nr:DNA polymerase I [Planctomycetota bacterium]